MQFALLRPLYLSLLVTSCSLVGLPAYDDDAGEVPDPGVVIRPDLDAGRSTAKIGAWGSRYGVLDSAAMGSTRQTDYPFIPTTKNAMMAIRMRPTDAQRRAGDRSWAWLLAATTVVSSALIGSFDVLGRTLRGNSVGEKGRQRLGSMLLPEYEVWEPVKRWVGTGGTHTCTRSE